MTTKTIKTEDFKKTLLNIKNYCEKAIPIILNTQGVLVTLFSAIFSEPINVRFMRAMMQVQDIKGFNESMQKYAKDMPQLREMDGSSIILQLIASLGNNPPTAEHTTAPVLAS
jgi:hypothetical protein